MLTEIMTWASAGALLRAAPWLSSGNFQAVVQTVVCTGALLAVAQAIRAGKYLWTPAFVAIAVIFNPVLPPAFSWRTLFWLDWACLMTFLLSLGGLRRQPALALPSMPSPMPRSKSL